MDEIVRVRREEGSQGTKNKKKLLDSAFSTLHISPF